MGWSRGRGGERAGGMGFQVLPIHVIYKIKIQHFSWKLSCFSKKKKKEIKLG